MVRQLTSVGLVSLLLAGTSSADILFATSYNDHSLNTLELKSNGLSVQSKTFDCGSEPTWMTLDFDKKVLFCLNEGWAGNASISSFRTNANGKLDTLDVLPVLKSPVASTLYGAWNNGLAVAHYDTSTFSTFNVANPRDLALIQNETYTLPAPGPVPDRQDAPHLHDAILDPTRKFILVPDLGSDLIRVYKLSAPPSLAWTALPPVKAVPASGPRHGAFITAGATTFFYTVNELGNSITGYKVSYAGSAIQLKQLFTIPTHGPGTTVPAGTKASELVASPDNRFIVVASRLEYSLRIPNFDPKNSTKLASDPLITHAVDRSSGSLSLVQVAPAGGIDPRGFSLNKRGDKLVSALQDDNRVVVYARDVGSGKLGALLGWAVVGAGPNNGPNYAIFYE